MQIPFNYQPRDYQLPLLQAIDSGYKRAVCVWHRRAGKDKTLLNIVAKKMFEKVGAYYYFFPSYRQGKKILWNGIDKTGFKFLNHIPKEIRKREDSTEMLIETINGSIFQVIGTDNPDSIVGSNPIGCVFSEYSLQDPSVWGYIRPILEENGGWAIFNYTSRGRNHGFTLLQYAKNNPDDWFVSVLPATQTDVFTQEQLDKEREQYILEDGDDLRYRQEYLCSFDGAVQGSYYGKIIQELDEQGRIRQLPVEDIQTHTVWDLGVGDSTAIWFVQVVYNEYRIIDYYETNGEGLAHYAKVLQDRGYVYGDHWAPHDIQVKELGSGASRLETAKKLGINFKVVPKLSIDDGIQAARMFLKNCWFDEKKTEKGLEALRNYHKEYDEKNKTFKDHPHHDWSSHASDAFRYLAIALKKPEFKNNYQPSPANSYYPELGF